MAGGVALATRLEQEPGAPLGLVDPHLDQACGGDVAVLVAHVVRLAKARRKLLVVLAQLGEHVQGLYVLGVVIQYALRAGDAADGLQRGSADLADALRNRVRHRIELIGLLVAELRSVWVAFCAFRLISSSRVFLSTRLFIVISFVDELYAGSKPCFL